MAELLVDLGNSRAKLGWLDGGRMYFLGACLPEEGSFPSLPDRPCRIWLASVVRPEREARFLDRLGGRDLPLTRVSVPDFVHHQETLYAPDQLGVDRWLAVLACRALGYRPAVVVDAGTATTVDLLDAQGRHLGGYIVPGIALMRASLESATAFASGAQKQGDDGGHDPPRTTEGAIACGTIRAQYGVIDHALARLGPAARLVLGGGGAVELEPLLSQAPLRVEQLVLEGLAVLARREGPCVG